MALFGLRKMGKSSLLHVVRDQLPYAAAVIDLEPGRELGELYGRIVAAWRDRLQILMPMLDWETPMASPAETPSAHFGRVVRTLLAVSGYSFFRLCCLSTTKGHRAPAA